MCVHVQRTWGRVALLGLLVLIVMGAGCQNAFRKNPEDVLRTALDRSVTAESVRMGLAANIDVRPEEKPAERVRLEISVTSAGAERANGQQAAAGTLTVTFEAQPGNGRLVLDERVVGDVVYLRLQDIEFTAKDGAVTNGVGIDAIVGAVKGMIGGQWVTVDPKELAQFNAAVSAETLALFDPARRRALHARMEEVVRANPILAFRGDLGSVKVDRTSTYHYTVGLRMDALEAILRAVVSDIGQEAGNLDEVTAFFAKPEVRQTIDRVEGEIWIAKRSMDILKVTFPINITNPGGQPGMITGQVTITYSDWGGPVTVEAPADAKTMTELLGAFLGASRGLPIGGPATEIPVIVTPPTSETRLPGNDARNPTRGDADGDGLPDDQEAFYGSNARNPDTDGDGFTDGDEVNRGYSPTAKGKKLFDVDAEE